MPFIGAERKITRRRGTTLENYCTVTNGVLKDIAAQYGMLTRQKNISYEALSGLIERFSPVLAKEKEFDKEGITTMILYAAPRLPPEIFSRSANIDIKFNDDPNFFVDENGLKEGVATSQDRKRWHRVENIGNKKERKLLITIHAQSQTAVIETLLHLSIVEMLRNKVRQIDEQREFSREESLFFREIYHLLFNQVDAPKKGSKPSKWIDRRINVIQSKGLPQWDKLVSSKSHETKTAAAFGEMAKEFVEDKTKPSMILFSNSHSLKNVLSHYMFNKNVGTENSQQTLRYYIVKKAFETWNVNRRPAKKTPLWALGESLSSLKIANLLPEDFAKIDPQMQFIIDNMIIYDLTKNKSLVFNDEVIDGFCQEFHDEERIKKMLGIKNVIEAHKSPTADPLFYINFEDIEEEVIAGSNALLKPALSELRAQKLAAFFTPYAPGDMTYSLIRALKTRIKEIKAVSELGKVAHLITKLDADKLIYPGQMVLPFESISILDRAEAKDITNLVNEAHVRPFESRRLVRKVTLMNLLSVIFQDNKEIIEFPASIYQDDLLKNLFSINMEIDAFQRAISELDLVIFELDYISDHVIPLSLLEKLKGLGQRTLFKQIDKKLNRAGRHAVNAGTAAILLAWADHAVQLKDTTNVL